MNMSTAKKLSSDSVPGFDQVDRVLLALSLAEPRPGLEERVLGRLHLEAESAKSARLQDSRLLVAHAGMVPKPPFDLAARLRSWAPIAMAASLGCILAGGLLIQHETPPASSAVSLPRQPLTPQTIARPAGASSEHAFATASARRKPAGALSAGGREGRATRTAAESSAQATRGGEAIAPPPRIYPE